MIQTVENIGEKLVSMLTYDASQPLIFSSGLFLFLFAGFLFFYGFTRRAPMARIVYVILFSLYFYYKSSGIYFLLLVFASVSDYWIAHAIYKVRTQRAKYWLVGLSVLVNLGMLGYFKYTNFLIEIANNLFGQGFLNFQNIFLPVGISFFVFQSMSYTIDICRGQLKPLNNWADYLFYLSFFPQLVAGPIVRAKDFIPQIRQNPLRVTREMFGMGVFLILIGLFKKAVISDYISLNFVDRIFDEPLLYSGFECLMGIYGYALQIYCDFSGYSDMAIGIALLLGFRFPKNFDAPYKSATITEFWRRWHISLSTWLRDYLYISLGGNRKGRIRTYFNLLVTMLLGGLWHGAAVRFILWGALHGIALALHKLWLSVVPGSKATGAEMRWFWRIPGIFFTFNLVCFGWLMFRAESMKTVQLMLHQIFTNFNPSVIPQVLEGYAGIFLLVGIGYLLHMLPDRCDRWAQRFVTSLPTVVQVLLAACVIWLVMQVKSSDIQPFIYFQFKTTYALLRRIPVSGSQFRRRSLPGPDHDPHLGHGDLDSLLPADTLAGLPALRMAQHAAFPRGAGSRPGALGHALRHLQALGSPETPLGRFSSPLAPDVLSGPRRTRHSGRLALRLAACRAPHTEQPRTRSRRSRRREIRHRILPRRDDRGSRRNVGRRHPPPLVHMARDRRSAADLLLAHLPGQTLPRRSVARHRRRHPDGSFHALAL